MLSGGHRDHAAVFYSSDDELAGKVAEYLFGAMRGGGAGIVVASAAHRTAIERRLEQGGVQLGTAQADGTYLALDGAAVMSKFMINSFADPAGFYREISPLVKNASRRHREVRVYGEMVELLWAADLPGAAVDVEALWNELASQYSFSLLCAYPSRLLSERDRAHEIEQVLSAHTASHAANGRGEAAMSL